MAAQAVATRQQGEVLPGAQSDNPLVAFRGQLEQRASEFKMALPAHISPEKFQRTVLTAAQANPHILKADRRSLITSCMKAAQDGLLPDGREAALVPFVTRQKINGEWQSVTLCQYMPMVYGLRKKILQSGEIKDIQTSVVYRQEIEQGHFVYEEGTERMLRHKPLLDPAFEPTDDDIAAAYSVATLGDGSRVFEVMRRSDINKVRQASQTGAVGRTDRSGKPIPPKGPWVDWFSEMAKKTVMRRHSKTLPMSSDLTDLEGDEITASASATHVLSSVAPDEPEPIMTLPGRDADDDDVSDETPHDPETGEVKDEPSQPAKARRQRASKPEPEARREPQPDATGIERADGQAGYDLNTSSNADAQSGAGSDDTDWDAWLAEYEEAVDAIEGVMDVNSYHARAKDALAGAPEGVQNRAVALKDARIDAIKLAARR